MVKSLGDLKSSVKGVAIPEAKAAEAVIKSLILELEARVHAAEDLPKSPR